MAPQSHPRYGRLAKAILILYLGIASFPGWFSPIQTGLDGSWVHAINILAASARTFGRDTIFSYGPLGYLLVPLNVGSNLIYAALLRIAAHALFVLVLAYYSQRRVLQWLIFAATFLLAYSTAFGDSYEHQLLLLFTLLLGLVLDRGGAAFAAAAGAGVLGAFLLLAKFSAGLSCLAVGVALTAALLLSAGRAALRLAGCFWLAYALASGSLAWAYLESPANYALWLQRSLMIAGGYSVSMSHDSHTLLMSHEAGRRVLLLGLLPVIVQLAVLVVSWANRMPLRYPASVVAAMMFFAFKNGMVRPDAGHFFPYVNFSVVLLAVLLLNARSRAEVRLSLAAVLAVAAPILWLDLRQSGPAQSQTGRTVSGQRGWANLRALTRLDETRRALDDRGRLNLRERTLPAKWVKAIGEARGRVGVLPWEISHCQANGLEWSPNPVLQAYAAYTASLDRLAASQFVESRAPEFALVEFADIDGRNPFMSTPATWRALLQNYELLESDDSVALLTRRPRPATFDTASVRRERVQVGQWVEVPASAGLAFAALEMRLRWFGEVARLLYKVPPVYCELSYEDGRTLTYRMLPDTAGNGLLMNHMPTSLASVKKLLSGYAGERVVRFKISDHGGAAYYSRWIAVTWSESPCAGAARDQARAAARLCQASGTRGFDSLRPESAGETSDSPRRKRPKYARAS